MLERGSLCRSYPSLWEQQAEMVFTDRAGVQRNDPTVAEVRAQHIGSVGLGLRMFRGVNMSLRLDHAVAIDGGGR